MIFNMVVSGSGGGGGDLPWQTFVGNPLEFDTPTAHTLQSVTVGFEPIQDTSSGDPSPSNICPITGHTEVNVFTGDIAPLEFIDGYYYNDSGAISSSVNTRYEVDYIPVANGNYYFVFDSTSTNRLRVHEYDANKTWLRQIISTVVNSTAISYMPSSDASFIRYSYPIASGDSNICKTITNVPLGGTYYGGTLDVTTGVLTVTHVLWTKNTSAMDNGEDYPGWKNSGIKNLMGAGLNTSFQNQIMNMGNNFSINTKETKDILFLSKNYYGSSMTQTAWQALAIDVQIAVELATPQTYQLTPQQVQAIVGLNVMWTDCVSLTVQARGTNV